MKINLGKLKAANLFASKEETRYYLNGVFFEIENKQGHLVATDGHRLIKIPMGERGQKIKGDDLKVIIPRQLIDKIKPVRGVEMCNIIFSNSGAIEIEYDGASYKDSEVDGTFPDYRRVIPDQEEKAAQNVKRRAKFTKKEMEAECADIFEIGFNPKFLADFAKVNETLGFKGVGVRLKTTGAQEPTIIQMGSGHYDEYLAVLMPMRV